MLLLGDKKQLFIFFFEKKTYNPTQLDVSFFTLQAQHLQVSKCLCPTLTRRTSSLWLNVRQNGASAVPQTKVLSAQYISLSKWLSRRPTFITGVNGPQSL